MNKTIAIIKGDGIGPEIVKEAVRVLRAVCGARGVGLSLDYALLGGAVGVLEGVLLVWVFAFLLRGLLGMYPEGWWIFRADTIGHTFLFRYFADPTLLGQLA